MLRASTVERNGWRNPAPRRSAIAAGSPAAVVKDEAQDSVGPRVARAQVEDHGREVQGLPQAWEELGPVPREHAEGGLAGVGSHLPGS
jgi:hypothetical protein